MTNKATSFNATIRAVNLAQRAAGRGDAQRAHRAWSIACEFAWRTGGLSGAATGGKVLTVEHKGRSFIVWAPRGI